MYVHSGGLEGVTSQLSWYKHKGLLDDARTIQSYANCSGVKGTKSLFLLLLVF
jgi:hypothetical protein